MYFSLSWRNIWRNKKRTLIVAASIFFAVLLAVVMRSMQLGSYAHMIDSSAKMFTGYLQVQQKDYWENRSPEKSFILPNDEKQALQQIEHVKHITPRLEAYALVSHDSSTKVAQIIGIDPESENAFTGLKKRLRSGQYLTTHSNGVVIAEGLARMLHLQLGDSLILYGQGYHGQIAAALLPVLGIAHMPLKIMNNGMVFMTLTNAQEVFWMPGRITSLPILIDDVIHLDNILEQTRAVLHKNQRAMPWDEMLPELKQNIEADNGGGIIMLAILYIVIGFGVLGTVMMMVAERAKEFSILISVGMRKWRLVLATTIETLMVSFLGLLAGLTVSYPIIWYLMQSPIPLTGDAAKIYDKLGIEAVIAFSNNPGIFSSQAEAVLIIALIAIIYPFLFIRKLDPAKTMHR